MLWVLIRIVSPTNICCGGSLESPRRGDSNEHPQNICCGGSVELPRGGDSRGEAILMSTHNICLYGEISKIIP